jgi:hypothetical protein
MAQQFRGPYSFGNQVGEPFRGPYTFSEPGDLTNQVHANPPVMNAGAPAGRAVSFTVVDGEPAFVIDWKDGTREGNSSRIFDHIFAAAGTFVVALTDVRGRATTRSVTVA